MRILVLMPCDERAVYLGASLYRHLPDNLKDNCFIMPMFMDYLVSTKTVGNWVYAFFDSLVSAEALLRNDENTDLIIVGNVDKKYKFDIVLNLQVDGESLPYKDNFIEHIQTLVEEEPILSKRIDHLYTNAASTLALYNAELGAQLIADLMATDNSNEIIKIKEKYEELSALRAKVGPDVPIE